MTEWTLTCRLSPSAGILSRLCQGLSPFTSMMEQMLQCQRLQLSAPDPALQGQVLSLNPAPNLYAFTTERTGQTHHPQQLQKAEALLRLRPAGSLFTSTTAPMLQCQRLQRLAPDRALPAQA